MKVRRVVTGHSPEGKAIFASDEAIEPAVLEKSLGIGFYTLWGSDAVPAFPDDGSLPETVGYFPRVGGFRSAIITLPPDSAVPPEGVTQEEIQSEMQEKLPGAIDYMEPDAPGMHTTDTIDFEYVISGRVVLELDDGEKRELGPGDTVVQNGTRHAWRNPFEEPCRRVIFMVGAERV